MAIFFCQQSPVYIFEKVGICEQLNEKYKNQKIGKPDITERKDIEIEIW